MGETLPLFKTTFNKSLRIESRDEHLSADGGAVLLRELLERTGLMEWFGERLFDPRNPNLITYQQKDLLRTALLLIAQGWGDQDDADALRFDPALRLGVDHRRGTSALEEESHLASQPTLSRLIKVLSWEPNRSVLEEAVVELAGRNLRTLNRGHRRRRLTVDFDSLPIEVHGHQPGSAYNGHYHQRIYHPLIASVGETGDLLGAELREGQVHTADGALDYVLRIVDQARERLCQVALVRMDAGFPNEEVLGGLEARGIPYIARLRDNAVLKRMAEPHLKRPAGRPPKEPRIWFHEQRYQAGAWSKPRRIVQVVLERPGELFLDYFWLITSQEEVGWSGERLLREYRQRGKAEAHMGELMDVLSPALSSSGRTKSHYRGNPLGEGRPSIDAFAHNEVILWLNLLAYELLHLGRSLMERVTREGWSVRRFRERVLKAAGRVAVHARRATLIIGEGAARYWRLIWPTMERLRWAS